MAGLRTGFALMAAALLAGCATVPSQRAEFEAARVALDGHIRTLASPEYGGRMPGTEGGQLTEKYVADTLAGYGYEAGAADGSWFQKVGIERYSPSSSSLVINGKGKPARFEGDGLIVRLRADGMLVPDSGVVFVGSGEGLHEGSLAGQVVLVRADDVQQLADDLLDAEPAAIVTLFDDQDRFDRFARNFRRGRYGLASEEAEATAFALFAPGFTARLLDTLHVTDEQLGERAAEAEGPVVLDVRAKLTVDQDKETVESANVIGVLHGKVKGSGTVMMLAHWDHLGTCGQEGDEDRLCNGAVDNASGVGVMLETARRIAAEGPLDRDLYVIGTTAEELGLLGAEAFAEDPPFPLPTVVAAFNMDTMAISPRGAPITVIGDGRTPLDHGIREVAESLGRKLDIREKHQEFVARQDGWALLSRDVPAVLVGTAMGDEAAFGGFMSSHYHRASDEWREDLELGGATEDILLHVALLHFFGNEASYRPGDD